MQEARFVTISRLKIDVARKKQTIANAFERYNLSNTDKKVIEFKIRFPEITHEEIAQLAESDRSYVTVCLNKPAVKKVLAELDGTWFEILLKNKEKAARKLVRHIDNPVPAISIRACEQILQIDKLDLTNTEPESDNF